MLWISTKSPVPVRDGGCAVELHTVAALHASGVEVTVLAPLPPRDASVDRRAVEAELSAICTPCLVDARPTPLPLALLRSVVTRRPVTIARHDLTAIRCAALDVAARGAFDVIHAEQLQSFPAAQVAARGQTPVVLRAQNVESEMWFRAAEVDPLRCWVCRLEARRLVRFERLAVHLAACTVTLTEPNAQTLRALSGAGSRVECVLPPFPARLPAAGTPVEGQPAVVLLGSSGWRPNRDGFRWFFASIWPEVRQALPDVRVHAYGEASRLAPRTAAVVRHGIPPSSEVAFPPGAILVVPLRVASGIRMRILEAWARGVPVVATSRAAEGLGAVDRRDLLLADTSAAFTQAIRDLETTPGLRERLAAGGHQTLVERHAPERIAAQLVEIYSRAVAASRRT